MEARERWISTPVKRLVSLSLVLILAKGDTLLGKLTGRAGLPGRSEHCMGIELDPVRPCKFYILDISELAVSAGLPACSLDSFVTDPESGQILPRPSAVAPNVTVSEAPQEGHHWIYPYSTKPHYHSQNAGPWYVHEALRGSPNLVASLEEADAVYVHDYCHIMWALSEHGARDHWWLRAHAQLEHQVGSQLLAAYRVMTELPRWRQTGGRDFAFYHSHSGFSWGDDMATSSYQQFVCTHFQWALMLVVEEAQRWRCLSYNPRTLAIAPYSSTELVTALPTASSRTHLLFFRGSCDPPVAEVPGKLMRSLIIASLREVAARAPQPAEGEIQLLNACCSGREAAPEVACTEANISPLNEFKWEPHAALLRSMAAATFCLVLPGNSQSSQRLTEAMLARCIPVLVGPPWHTLPYAGQVDYASFAVFLEIRDADSNHTSGVPWWPRAGTQAKPYLAPMAGAAERFSSTWWSLGAPRAAVATLSRLSSILPYLQSLSAEAVAAKAAALEQHRPLFVYATQPQHPPSASDQALELMCLHARLGVRDTR